MDTNNTTKEIKGQRRLPNPPRNPRPHPLPYPHPHLRPLPPLNQQIAGYSGNAAPWCEPLNSYWEVRTQGQHSQNTQQSVDSAEEEAEGEDEGEEEGEDEDSLED